MTSDTARTVVEAVQRLRRRDERLVVVDVSGERLSDGQLTELVDSLAAGADTPVKHVFFGDNAPSDAHGAQLARYLAASTTVQRLSIAKNRFDTATYEAFAAALCVNTSLRGVHLTSKKTIDRARVDAAFVHALRVNPLRPLSSFWWLYQSIDEYQRLKQEANKLGHPNLQSLLVLIPH